MGFPASAMSSICRVITLDPNFTIGRFRSHLASDNPAYLSGCERACDGMRMAGVPDG